MAQLPTILLTGATGFLGSHLLDALLSKGYKVVILKRTTSDVWRINHLLGQVVSYDIDSQSLDLIYQENSIDYVMHMATLYRKFDGGHDVSEMMDANISFPIQLIELGLINGIKGFINTGTFFEYDCSSLPINENASIKPFNLYAKTKLAFESMLKTYSGQININTFRLFSPYGEKDNDKLIPMIIQKALAKEQITLSDGMQKLDFTYSKDIVDAYVTAIEKMVQNDVVQPYTLYNLGSGLPTSVREVVSVIEQNLNESLNVVWGKPSTTDIPIAYADNSKISHDLGWSPAHSIHEGISNTIAYYREKDY